MIALPLVLSFVLFSNKVIYFRHLNNKCHIFEQDRPAWVPGFAQPQMNIPENVFTIYCN
jgi:hypothetical protein